MYKISKIDSLVWTLSLTGIALSGRIGKCHTMIILQVR